MSDTEELEQKVAKLEDLYEDVLKERLTISRKDLTNLIKRSRGQI